MKLLTPDAFLDEPLGYAGNQLGHAGVGAILAFVICIIYFSVFGEYPIKIYVFFLILIGYVGFELKTQTFKGFDTIEDTTFVCLYGSGLFLLSVSEIEIGNSDVKLNMLAVIPVLTVMLGHLMIGMVWRIFNEEKNND